MKKRSIWISGILVVVSMAFLASVENAGGPPEGYTGSPADGRNCSQCHSGMPQTLPNAITTNIPPSGYVPGDTYTVTVSVSHPTASRFGFQLSPQNLSGQLLGQLIATSNETQVTPSKKYIQHTLAGTGGSGGRSWSFQWVAPPAGTGDVTFYAAINAANGNGNTSGDQIFLSSLTVSELVSTIATHFSHASPVHIAVLPGTSQMRISATVPVEHIEIFLLTGEKVHEQAMEGKQTISLELPSFLRNQLLLVQIHLADQSKVVRKIIL